MWLFACRCVWIPGKIDCLPRIICPRHLTTTPPPHRPSTSNSPSFSPLCLLPALCSPSRRNLPILSEHPGTPSPPCVLALSPPPVPFFFKRPLWQSIVQSDTLPPLYNSWKSSLESLLHSCLLQLFDKLLDQMSKWTKFIWITLFDLHLSQ